MPTKDFKMKKISLLENPEETQRFIAKKFGMSVFGFYQRYGKKSRRPKPKLKKQNQIDRLLQRADALKV